MSLNNASDVERINFICGNFDTARAIACFGSAVLNRAFRKPVLAINTV